MKKLWNIFFVLAVLTTLVCSCNKDKIYEQRQTLQDNTWNRLEGNKTLEFKDIEIEDTSAVYDIYVTLRHTPYVNEKTIKFILKISYPDGITRESSHSIDLIDESGKNWKGDAMGDLIDVEKRCRAFVSLPVKGKYTISLINQGTYFKTVGLMDIGVRVKKSDIKEYKNV